MAMRNDHINPELLDLEWDGVHLEIPHDASQLGPFTSAEDCLYSPSDFRWRTSTSTSPYSVLPSAEIPSNVAEYTQKPARRRPVPCKGHTKSRRGCFNCKRRKVKCQENFPTCRHCDKAGLVCEYPRTPALLQKIRMEAGSYNDEKITTLSRYTPTSFGNHMGSCRPVVQMNGTPGHFSMQDMRFFHHFLIHGYPHLPIGADQIWITTIPAIAHEYDYLMHAILALSASHLSALNKEDLSTAAISHRLRTISCFNKAISEPAKNREEADARLATSLALTFQSVHFEDNYAEFLTMNRGCFVIGADRLLADHSSAFWPLRDQHHLRIMSQRLKTATVSPCCVLVLDNAVEAVGRLKEVCIKDYELEYINIMLETLRCAYNFPEQAYARFNIAFSFPSRLPEVSFKELISHSNVPGQLLLATWLGVQFALVPILIYEFRAIEEPRQHVPTVMNSWIGNIAARTGEGHKRYWEWPLAIVKRPWQTLFAPKAIEEFAKGWTTVQSKGKASEQGTDKLPVRSNNAKGAWRQGAHEILGDLKTEALGWTDGNASVVGESEGT